MKILTLENSLDDLLNVKISVNGGQSYTDYNVSSLKNGGLTLDCNPSDLKVICDTNILNYIKVFADGEKLNAGSGGVNTYAHKIEIKFDNMSLSYYGQGESIYTIDFTDIADGAEGYNSVSVSGDVQEISNFYPAMRSPSYGGPYTEESKIAYHIYLKDSDTENLVRGVGLVWSTYENVEELGILFNSGTQDKFFTNTLVFEWGLEVSSGGGSNQTTIQELSVTENGTYNAGINAAYNPVIVNVPSGGSVDGDAFYCWKMTGGENMSIYTNYDKTPDASVFRLSKRINYIGASAVTQGDFSIEEFGEKISDTEFTTTVRGSTYNTYKRYPSGDLTGGDAGSVSEDKLLCYYKYNGRTNGCVVYTDKPATKINYGDVTGEVSELLPCDGGKHLFFTNTDLTLYPADDSQALCQLVYEDGTTISLKDKFIYT